MTTAFCPTPVQRLTPCCRVDDTCQIECSHHYRLWPADSAHTSPRAAQRVRWLNGGRNMAGRNDALTQAETEVSGSRLRSGHSLTRNAVTGSTLARWRIRRTQQRRRWSER